MFFEFVTAVNMSKYVDWSNNTIFFYYFFSDDFFNVHTNIYQKGKAPESLY
jgi:hypothetical protein